MAVERSPENVIEWLTGDVRVGMTLSQQRFVNRVARLHKDHPDEVGLVTNEDGSVFASVPIRWIKISPPRKMSEEQRATNAARLQNALRKSSQPS